MARRTVKAWGRIWWTHKTRPLQDVAFTKVDLKPKVQKDWDRIIPVTVTYDDGKKKRRKK